MRLPRLGLLFAVALVPLVLWAVAAEAQVWRSALAAPVERGLTQAVPAPPGLPGTRIARDEYRVPPDSARNGLIGAVALGRNLQVAVGRLAVPNFTAPRMEAANIRRSDRRITAVGFSFRF